MNKLKQEVLTRILPDNLTKDDFVRVLAEAVEVQIKELYKEIEEIFDLTNVDKLPEVLLDYLAFERHVDFYEYDFDISTKRKLLKASTQWHRHKGTKYAVEKIASTIFGSAYVLEWFEYDGTPYRFMIEIGIPKEANIKNNKKILTKLVENTKNERSWLDGISVIISDETIAFIDTTYHYPVSFKYCNHVYGNGYLINLDAADVSFVEDTYNYPVNYYVNEVISRLIEQTLYLADTTYNYEVPYKYCNHVYGNGVIKNVVDAIDTTEEDTYDYGVNYYVNEVVSKTIETKTAKEDVTYDYKTNLQYCDDVYGKCDFGGTTESEQTTSDESYGYNVVLYVNEVVSKAIQRNAGFQEETYEFNIPYVQCGTFYACE